MEKAVVIVFYSQNTPTREYYQSLQAYLNIDSVILLAGQFRRLNLREFFKFSENDFPELFLQYSKETQLLTGNEPTKLQVIWFWLKTRWYYSADVYTLKKHNPQLVVVWNGLKYRRALFAKVADKLGIPCVYFENGLLPNTTVCDNRGVNANNSMPRNAAFYHALDKPLHGMADAPNLVRRESKHIKQATNKLLPENFLFVPFQVDTDSQIIQFSPWIHNMEQFFQVMIEAVKAEPKLKLVFKEHPSSPIDYAYLHKQLPESIGVFANEYTTQELIEKSEAVVTINSTIGIESLLFNKKIIVLGDAFYCIGGLVKSAKSQQELTSYLGQLDLFTVDNALIEKFLDYLKHQYLLPESWKSPTSTHFKAVSSRLNKFYLNKIKDNEVFHDSL